VARTSIFRSVPCHNLFASQERSAQIWSRRSFSGQLETRRRPLISSYYKILWSRLKGIKRDGALLHTHRYRGTHTGAEDAAQSGAIDSGLQVLCCIFWLLLGQNQNQLIVMRPKPEAGSDRRRDRNRNRNRCFHIWVRKKRRERKHRRGTE